MTNIFKNENASKQNQTFSTTYELFKNITIENAGDSFGSDDIEDVGTGRSSSLDCNDIHSVFAFLAFLFALLNFVLNMGKRRRREVVQNSNCQNVFHYSQDPLLRENMLAVYSMYRGLLNFLDSVQHMSGDTCSYMTLCEAGHVAGTRGHHGAVIALVGGYRAGTWIESREYGTCAEVMSAVTLGVSSPAGTCEEMYPCDIRSPGYRSPVTSSNKLGAANLSPEDKIIFRKVLQKIKIKTFRH